MQKKLKLINPLIAPLLSLFFIIFSSTPFTTYISLKLQFEGFTEALIGLIHSAFYFGFLIGSVRAEKIIIRVGYIRSFVAYAAIFGATILIQGMYIHTILWMVSRFVGGFSIAALYIIIESWLLSGSSQKTRGRFLSVYMIVLYGAQAFSQMFVQLLDVKTLIAFLFFGFSAYLSIIPVAVIYSKTPETTHDIIKKKISEVYKYAPYSFYGAFISGLILSSIYSFLPIFAQVNGLSVPYIMTITLAGGFVLQWPIGSFSDIFERRKVLISSGLCLIIPCVLMLFFANLPFFAYLFCFFVGGFSFVIYPISISHASDKFDYKYIPFVMGIMSLTYGIGATIGPFLTSLFMEKNSSGIFLFITFFAFILTLFGIYFRIKYPKITPKEEKTEFIPISGSVPIGSELTSQAIEQTKETAQKEEIKKNEALKQ